MSVATNLNLQNSIGIGLGIAEETSRFAAAQMVSSVENVQVRLALSLHSRPSSANVLQNIFGNGTGVSGDVVVVAVMLPPPCSFPKARCGGQIRRTAEPSCMKLVSNQFSLLPQ